MNLFKDIGELFGLCIKLLKTLILVYIKFTLIAFAIIFVVSICRTCHAHDEDGGWFCDTQASRFQGGIHHVCGVAEASSESAAREQALQAVYREFKSTHPEKGNYNIEVGRTDCSKSNSGYRCVRLVRFQRTGPMRGVARL